MAWMDLIPGCFGEVDQIFAGHALDAQRAIRLLLGAKEQLVSYDDLKKAIKVHLANKGCGDEHISKQMARVAKLYGPWF